MSRPSSQGPRQNLLSVVKGPRGPLGDDCVRYNALLRGMRDPLGDDNVRYDALLRKGRRLSVLGLSGSSS